MHKINIRTSKCAITLNKVTVSGCTQSHAEKEKSSRMIDGSNIATPKRPANLGDNISLKFDTSKDIDGELRRIEKNEDIVLSNRQHPCRSMTRPRFKESSTSEETLEHGNTLKSIDKFSCMN